MTSGVFAARTWPAKAPYSGNPDGLALLGEPVWVHGAFGWGGGTDWGVCIFRDIHGLHKSKQYMKVNTRRHVDWWNLSSSVCLLAGSCVWLIIATAFKMPVSGSHSIIGAIVGFSLVAKGARGVSWFQLGMVGEYQLGPGQTMQANHKKRLSGHIGWIYAF